MKEYLFEISVTANSTIAAELVRSAIKKSNISIVQDSKGSLVAVFPHKLLDLFFWKIWGEKVQVDFLSPETSSTRIVVSGLPTFFRTRPPKEVRDVSELQKILSTIR
jgi:hypothetical protein